MNDPQVTLHYEVIPSAFFDPDKQQWQPEVTVNLNGQFHEGRRWEIFFEDEIMAKLYAGMFANEIVRSNQLTIGNVLRRLQRLEGNA